MRKLLKGISDIVFPQQCIGCGTILTEERLLFCSRCFAQMKFISSPLCSVCGLPYSEAGESDHLCGDCLQSNPAFFVARAMGQYEQILMEVIHRFKYGRKISLGNMLGSLMAGFSYPSFRIKDYSLIMPVPLHPKRLRQRGFNQALILAREISRHFSIALDFLSLRRIVFTEPQVGLGRDMREHNIKGAFSVADQGRIKGEKIILVDDVYTTGSTVRECAQELMKSKAEEVAVLTLARAS